MAEKKRPAGQAAIPAVQPTNGESFTMAFDNKTVDTRADAVAGIYDWIKNNTPAYGNLANRHHDYGTMATFGGQELVVSNAVNQSRLGSYQDLIIQVKDLPDTLTVFSRQEILEAGTGVEVDAQLGKPFKYEDKLVQAREKSKELDAKLKASIEPKPGVQNETVAEQRKVGLTLKT